MAGTVTTAPAARYVWRQGQELGSSPAEACYSTGDSLFTQRSRPVHPHRAAGFHRARQRFRLLRFQLPVLKRRSSSRPPLCLALSLALLSGTLAGAVAGVQTYTVKPGDTAYSVARLAGTDTATLLRLNELSSPDLKPGQVLRFPGVAAVYGPPLPAAVAPATRTHTVLPGQTLYIVARQYGLKATELQGFNHLSSSDLKSGQVLALPPGSAQVALVAPVTQVTVVVVQAGPPAPAAPLTASRPMQSPSAPTRLPAPQSASTQPLARHTVLPGQTLYAVARLYGLRPDDLLALNRLSGGDLRAGQVLLLPAGVVARIPASPQVPALTHESAATQLPGPVPPAAFPRGSAPASAIPDGTLISPGVPLPLPPGPNPPRSDVPQPPVPQPPIAQPPTLPLGLDFTGSDWRALAMSLLGVPYAYGGETRSGTDCSGLVLQVFGPLGLRLPRQSAQQAQAGVPVATPDLQAGDLLFFDTEGRGTVTHVGIYLGEGDFINANSYGGQVAVNSLSDQYFARRYLWARRVLGVLAQTH
jgi:peptidoglycan endopeptidase LytE